MVRSGTGVFTAGKAAGSFPNTVRVASGDISATATVVVTAGALASIVVTPNPATMGINATQQFTAVGRDADGNAVVFAPTWSVVAGGGAVNATGLFTAGTVLGTFANTVQASGLGVRGNATVNVTSGSVATMTVTPNPSTVLVGQTQQFTAVARDAGGNVVPVTPVWSVVAGGTINSSGLFTAGATPGTFNNTVRATSGGISGLATVIVAANPPPPPPPIVSLGSAAPNGIMAGTAFTCIIGGVINADIAIAPSSTVTGFPPCVITGTRHLNDAPAIQAQVDLTTAYNTLAGLPCPPANAIVANLGGTTKAAGVYCTASAALSARPRRGSDVAALRAARHPCRTANRWPARLPLSTVETYAGSRTRRSCRSYQL